MNVVDYIEQKSKDAASFGIFLLSSVPVTFAIFYALSYYTNSNLLMYIGTFICGLLACVPLWLLSVLFLLWKNPAKYKERETKLLGEKKAQQRRNYLLIFLSILWINNKEFNGN